MLYLTALQEGLLYGLLALGVYISLRVLDIPDLTTEGSFGFGSALAAVLAAGGHTYLSLPIAFLGGMAAGLITGLLQTKLQVHPVLAGIITMSGLYSVNLIVRGGPNLSIGAANLFKQFYKALHLTGDQRKVAGALLALEQRDFDGVAAQRALEIGKSGGVTGLEGRLRQALGLTE